MDDNVDELKGYTQSEINAHISKAERDMGYWKAEVRRHGELAEHDMWRESEISHMKSAERKYEAAKAEYNKWKGMKPDELKGFINDAEWHMKQAQYHSDRGEFSDASDHLKSAKMCTQ